MRCPGIHLQECFQGISNTRVKLSPCARIQAAIDLVHFCGENVNPVTRKIREDGITLRLAIRESFRNNTKRPVVCVIAQRKKEVTSLPSAFNTITNEEIQAKDELLVCIYTNTLKENLTLKYQ